jgi:hypothetical protein
VIRGVATTAAILAASWGIPARGQAAHPRYRQGPRPVPSATVVTPRMPSLGTYNPNYGYSDLMNPSGSYRGSSAPFQGNFSFPPGMGYGSIYGNSGHPGFNRFTGPAYASPYAWGFH